ncbi:MAG: hypothetical protein AB7J40_06275 [Candidatus Altimarinota bacterium]
MTDLEQPSGSQDREEVQKRINNFIQYINHALEDSGDLKLAEILFRLTVLMTVRQEFRLQIERLLYEQKQAPPAPNVERESSFDLEMSDVLSRTREIPLDRLKEQLQSEFFRIMKGNSVEITRNTLLPMKEESLHQQIRNMYKKSRKPLPTSFVQMISFARNCGVKVLTRDEFGAIATKISEIDYFGMILSTDQRLLSLYETNIGNFLVA